MNGNRPEKGRCFVPVSVSLITIDICTMKHRLYIALYIYIALKLSCKRHLPIYVLSLLFLNNNIPIYLFLYFL